MKERLVGTALGQLLLTLSHSASLHKLPLRNPEKGSMIANAVLADRLVTRLCPEGGTFLDVGAHIGSIFSTVRHIDKTVSIIAIEADPTKAENLSQRFSYCTVHGCAVGEKDGETAFFINTKAAGYSSLVPSHTNNQQKITVEIRKLDDILDTKAVDIVKIDIEGAELGALRGAARLITTYRPTIMFESTDTEVNALGYSAEQLWNWLCQMGYGVFTPDRLAHDAAPLTLDSFLDSHAYPPRTLNYFAVHQSKRIEIRDRARKILNVIPAG